MYALRSRAGTLWGKQKSGNDHEQAEGQVLSRVRIVDGTARNLAKSLISNVAFSWMDKAAETETRTGRRYYLNAKKVVGRKHVQDRLKDRKQKGSTIRSCRTEASSKRLASFVPSSSSGWREKEKNEGRNQRRRRVDEYKPNNTQRYQKCIMQ